jgi:hypothetical protein
MDRFELIERLGVGGFGSAWKARDKELDRTGLALFSFSVAFEFGTSTSFYWARKSAIRI